MSFFNDKDQPIDYTNKYNENIGSISPKSNNYDSHLTSYHSNNLFRNNDYSLFNQNEQQINQQHNNFNHFNNQFNNNQNSKINSTIINKVLDMKEDNVKGNYSYLFQDTTDCVNVYQTEDSPIIYSNDSPLSSLSLEFLTNLNPNDNLLNNKQFDNENNQLNSSNDSIQNYNMEGTPNGFSYDSPLSPLSLNLSFDDSRSSPFDLNRRMDSIKELKNKKDLDLKSINSTMSIDKSKYSSTRCSSINKLHKSSFGNLNDFQKNEKEDDYSLLDLEIQQDNKEQLNQIIPNFLNNKLVNNQQNNEESQNNYREEIDFEDGFEDGFEEYDDEQFYLNQCITAGRQTNNNRNSDLQQPLSNNLYQINQQSTFNNNTSLQLDNSYNNNSNHYESISELRHQEQLNEQEIPYYKINTKGLLNKKDLIKQISQKQQMTQSSFNHQQQQLENSRYINNNQKFANQSNNNYLNQQKQDKFKYQITNSIDTNSIDTGYCDDTSTVISNFTNKYGSRSMYTIDGEAEKRASSIVNARIPIQNRSQNYQFNQQKDLNDQDLYLQKQRLQQQIQQSQLNSASDNSPKQVKKGGLKKFFGRFNLKN